MFDHVQEATVISREADVESGFQRPWCCGPLSQYHISETIRGKEVVDAFKFNV